MIKSILYFVFAITIITLLVGLFTSDNAAANCSDSLINCIERGYHGSFWDKTMAGFSCIFKNVVCVFNQITAYLK